MDLSKRIKELREVKKISQSEMARLLGIEPTNYPRLEKRGDNLTFEWINKIATALGVSLGELLNLETPNNEVEKLEKLEKRVAELETRILIEDIVKVLRDSGVTTMKVGEPIYAKKN